MARHVLLVLSNPAEGREDEFNDWYERTHLPQVLAVPGFVAAERYRLTAEARGSSAWKYLAVYELDTDDPEATLTALGRAVESGDIAMSDVIDVTGAGSWLYTAIGTRHLSRNELTGD